MDAPPTCPFDCIVVTAANERQARSNELELERRKRGGIFPSSTVLVSVADPGGARVGSGGGTLNALVKAHEQLRARGAGEDREWRILCVHSGGDSQRSPTQSVCGKAWSALNCVGPGGHLCAPIDLLCFRVFQLCAQCPSGSFVVTSCDVLLVLPEHVAVEIPASGVWGLGIVADGSYGPHHGVYVTEDGASGPVKTFLQKASPDRLKSEGALLPSGEVLVDSGVVAFDAASTRALLALCAQEPFAGCCGNGTPFRFELYSDLMLAIGGIWDRGAFFAMASPDPDEQRMQLARELLWGAFNDTSFSAVVVPGAQFAHLGTTAELVAAQTGVDQRLKGFTQHFKLVDAAWSHGSAPGAVSVNSVLGGAPGGEGSIGAGAVVEHSKLVIEGGSGFAIGAGAIVSGLRRGWPGLEVADGMVVQQVRLGGAAAAEHGEGAWSVFVIFGVRDAVKLAFGSPGAQLCGGAWPEVLARLGASPTDIWPEEAEAERCLWTARLYPPFREEEGSQAALLLQAAARGGPLAVEDVATWLAARRRSLKEILAASEPTEEFAWRERLHEEIGELGPSSAKLLVEA